MKGEDIIVLCKFDTLIEANIVKTKLDANDIPCFLSDENLTNLINHHLSGGIRLHIFAQDKERATQLLQKDHLVKVEDDGIIECPRCHSKKILSNRSDTVYAKIRQVILGLFINFKKLHYCQDCGYEFG